MPPDPEICGGSERATREGLEPNHRKFCGPPADATVVRNQPTLCRALSLLLEGRILPGPHPAELYLSYSRDKFLWLRRLSGVWLLARVL